MLRNYLVKLSSGQSATVVAQGYVLGNDRDFVFWVGCEEKKVATVGFKEVAHVIDLGVAAQIC